MQDNQLSGTLPVEMGDLGQLDHWDTFGNKLEGDLPSSIAKLGGSVNYLYLQNEHTATLRKFYCRQRIEASAIGRKYNWQVMANEYIAHQYTSACANPYDVHEAFEALSGDV